MEERATFLQKRLVVLQCVPGRRREENDGESACLCHGVLDAGYARPTLEGTGTQEEEQG